MIGAGSETADGAVEERGMRPNGDVSWPMMLPNPRVVVVSGWLSSDDRAGR